MNKGFDAAKELATAECSHSPDLVAVKAVGERSSNYTLTSRDTQLTRKCLITGASTVFDQSWQYILHVNASSVASICQNSVIYAFMLPRSQGGCHLCFIADELDEVHTVPYLIKFILVKLRCRMSTSVLSKCDRFCGVLKKEVY